MQKGKMGIAIVKDKSVYLRHFFLDLNKTVW
jgi:hypothetical protein